VCICVCYDLNVIWCRPAFHWWENVKEVLENGSDSDESNIVVMRQLLGRVGYTMHYEKLDSRNYGLAQQRVRVFGLCMRVEGSGLSWAEADALCQKIMRKAKSLTVPPLPLKAFMLPATAPEVSQYLATKLKNRMPEKSNVDWLASAQELCKTKGIRLSDLQVPAATRFSPWYDALPTREQHALSIFFTLHGTSLRSIDLLHTLKWMHPILFGAMGVIV
jgi:site-specific DNA-cytosine methylase